MAQTENYKLYVVGAGEDPYVKDFVEQLCGENASNMTIIDNALKELKTSVSEGKALVSSAVTDMGVSTADGATYATIASNIKNISSDATASTGEILSGKTAYSGGKKITGTMVNQGAKTAALNCGGSYTIPAGYHNGSGKITANSLVSQTDGTAVAGDILDGKTAYVDGVKVTGTIATKSSSDLTASGATVSVPAGYYANDASKSVSTVDQATPIISVDSTTGVITASVTQGSGYVHGRTATNTSELQTQATTTITPSAYRQTAVRAGFYTTGAVFVAPVPTQTKSATPSKSKQTVTPDSGKFLSSVTIGAIPSMYITTSDANAAASDIANGKTAYVNGKKITGTIPEYTVSNISLIPPRSYGQDMDQFYISYVITEDGLFRKDTMLQSYVPLSEFGDATAAYVAEGKTFTSSAGLKVTGTMTLSTSPICEVTVKNTSSYVIMGTVVDENDQALAIHWNDNNSTKSFTTIHPFSLIYRQDADISISTSGVSDLGISTNNTFEAVYVHSFKPTSSSATITIS